MKMALLVAGEFEWLRSMAAWYAPSADLAAELLADTILRLLENAERFDVQKEFKPWAKKIMRNAICDHWRARKGIPLNEGHFPNRLYSESDTESNVIVREIWDILKRFSRTSKCIRTLKLYIEGYSYNEIKEIENVSLGTVQSRINYARRILKRYIR